MSLKKGDTVQLKPDVLASWDGCPDGREDNHQANIRACYGKDGEVWLDQDLRGCKYWNQADLELVK
jgi:hypothetical protein